VKLVCDEEFVVDRRWRADIRVPLERVLAVFDRRVFLTRTGDVPSRLNGRWASNDLTPS
jgi:hypothetical protein